MKIHKLCEEYFGTRDFYEILHIEKTATQKEIKKAYYKLSLSVHPDRVEESRKILATEKFKILGKVHSILQDSDKRKIYDSTGDFDEETEDLCDWLNYWRTLFKKITVEDIKAYEKEYIGSDTEKLDIKKAYLSTKGNMDRILEMVPFSKCESEPRIIELVQKMVDDGEVEHYKIFFNEPKIKRQRRHKKYQKENQECNKVNLDELSEQISKNQEERTKNFADMISSLEEKYGKSSKRKSISYGKAESSPNKKIKRNTRSSRK